jgi:His/Glu/Gln/Arg/opine family amino acid ABC transporter permease subunit
MGMDLAVIWKNLPFLLEGLRVTLQTAALVIAGGAAFGVGLGILRTSRLPVATQVASAYIEGIRGTPLLVVLFVVYFGLPPVIGYKLRAYEAAVVGFTLFIGAYIAEDYRSGLASVPPGQIEAGLASGLSRGQVLRHIVLPQAIRRMIPTLFNQFVRLLKFTSVASIIGVMELTGAAMTVNAREFQPFPILATLAATYLVACSLLSQVGRWLNLRYAITT